ncbi:MAG TPA: M1 family metallopeptidase [Gemmatimonadales bacterium]|nr:M1 family metallopeptidase [Gemmatimonadales bacterium]
MRTHSLPSAFLLASAAFIPATLSAQATPARATAATAAAPSYPKPAERSIRTTIPMTDMIRRAMAAGSRDSTGRPTAKYWQLWNDYTITASIDPATDMLTGHETVVLHNNSPDEMPNITLRLDENIFRAEAVRASAPGEVTDGFKISALSFDGVAADLNATGGRGAGGGGRRGGGAGGGAAPPLTAPALAGFNSTVGTIALQHAIPAHGTGTLDISWTYKIAGGNSRAHRMTGRWGDSLFQVTQWYPRVGVFDDLKGWDVDPYLGPSEFFNPFGHWDVKLTMPGGWIVGGTGVLQNPQEVLTSTARERLSHVLDSDSDRIIVGPDEEGPGKATAAGDKLTWHFIADTANDFAWGTAKHFVWKATRATVAGKGPIPVNMFYLPGNATNYENAGPILRHAIEFYGALWMPFSFPVHNAIDGPDNGMEYPMVVMSNQSPADHETGHEWWPMTVSGNETWYGWMDEGFNQYMNIMSDADAAARHVIQPRAGRGGNATATVAPRGGFAGLNGRGESYGTTSGSETEGTLMWDANYGGPNYSFQAYSKTPLMLSMLGGIVGDSAVFRAQSAYAKAWRFKHPSPWDYMFIMDHELHQNLDWFWYYWMFTTEAVDGSIKTVTTTPTHTAVVVHQAGEMPSPVVLAVQFAPTGPAIHAMTNSHMQDSVTAIVTWPVDVWFSGKRDFTANLTFGARKIARITLDPYGRFPDCDTADNVWPRDTAATAPAGGRGGRGGGRGGAGGRAPCVQ